MYKAILNMEKLNLGDMNSMNGISMHSLMAGFVERTGTVHGLIHILDATIGIFNLTKST